MVKCHRATIAYQNFNIHQQWSGCTCKVTPHFTLAVGGHSPRNNTWVPSFTTKLPVWYIESGYGDKVQSKGKNRGMRMPILYRNKNLDNKS